MGVQVVIHGYIECPFDFGRRAESMLVFEHNRSVIQSLPTTGKTSVYIDRSMFTVHSPTGIFPYFDCNLIAFGGSYKNMFRFESEWIREFELLLLRLCWHSATAFNEFGDICCHWQADVAKSYESAFADPPLPPPKWTKRFMQISRQEIPTEVCAGAGLPTK